MGIARTQSVPFVAVNNEDGSILNTGREASDYFIRSAVAKPEQLHVKSIFLYSKLISFYFKSGHYIDFYFEIVFVEHVI